MPKHNIKQKNRHANKLSKRFENLLTKSYFSTDITDSCGCNF